MKTQIKTQTNTDSKREQFRLDIFYRGQNFSLPESELPFCVGREKTCDIVVENELVSRTHCTFEIQDGQLGLLDKSTNGTFVMTGRSESVRVKDRFYPLVGQGYIKLGDRISLDDPDLMLFKVIKIPRQNS